VREDDDAGVGVDLVDLVAVVHRDVDVRRARGRRVRRRRLRGEVAVRVDGELVDRAVLEALAGDAVALAGLRAVDAGARLVRVAALAGAADVARRARVAAGAAVVDVVEEVRAAGRAAGLAGDAGDAAPAAVLHGRRLDALAGAAALARAAGVAAGAAVLT